MKITIDEVKPTNTPLKFPVLAASNAGKTIILFMDKTSGICIQHPHYRNGTFSNDWIAVDEPSSRYSNEPYWKILPPGTKVTFEQE